MKTNNDKNNFIILLESVKTFKKYYIEYKTKHTLSILISSTTEKHAARTLSYISMNS